MAALSVMRMRTGSYDSLISQNDSLKHLESLKDVPWYKLKVWDAVLDSGPNAAKYTSSVFNNPLLGTIW